MKITIKNLGAIKQANIDLKPLTIFVGPNNTGKTWTAYTLSAIFGEWGPQYVAAYTAGEIPEEYPPLDTALQRMLKQGNTSIDLIQFADDYAEPFINGVANLAKDKLREFLGARHTSFEETEIHIDVDEVQRQQIREYLKKLSREGKAGVSPKTGEALLNGLKEEKKREVYFYTKTEKQNPLEELPTRTIRTFLAEGVLRPLHSAFFPFTYVFPTERTTFIAFNYPTKPEETGGFAEDDKQQQTEILFARPVGRFLTQMWGAARVSKGEVKTPKAKTFRELSHILETDILNGTVDFYKTNGEVDELLYKPTTDVSLEIPVASSMVKELSPLAICLRYLAEKNELLIIDEPEMNLHPEAQVRLVEFLAILVNAGLRVLITTHSPYVVDHLVNLIRATECKDKETIAGEFYLKRTDAFISKEKVSVYLFDNGTATNILEEEGSIDWMTFSNVSDQLAKIYSKLLR